MLKHVFKFQGVNNVMDFKTLAEAFEKLEKISGRLEMTDILADLFKKSNKNEIDKLIYLLQGQVAPPFEGVEIGLGQKFVEQGISRATGHNLKSIEKKYKDKGDLGLVAEEFMKDKRQRSLHVKKMNVTYVYERFHKIATVSGKGSQEMKIKILTELFNNSSPVEAKYVARIPLSMLRLGIGDPTILDALSVKEVGDKGLRETLEEGYNVSSDLGAVARTFFEKGIKGMKKFEVKVGTPLLPALCERLPNAEDIIKKIGKCSVEAKYDGIRLQIHKDGDNVKIFSRRLEKMTHMFPDVIKSIKKLGTKNVILDTEALTYNEKTGEFYPFQLTVQRKRKYGIEKMKKEYPLKVFAFDILYKDGKDLTKLPYGKRRGILEKVMPKQDKVLDIAERIVTDDPKKLDKYFDEAISRGLEGIIAKDLKAPYTVGARKFAWIKLKRSYKGELSDTVDVVAVGYYKGAGLRAKFGFGGLLTCVYDKKDDEFKTIAKVGSGFTEKHMVEMRKLLEKIKVSNKPARVDSLLKPDIWVSPKYVVTVRADEITESPMHTAGKKNKKDTGYALRFPRMTGWIRFDRKPEDATTVSEIEKMFKEQRRSKIKS